MNDLNKKFVIIVLATLTLFGCAPVFMAGALSGATVINDKRTTGTLVEDQSIEFKALSAIRSNDLLNKNSRIVVVSYNTKVLLLGQVPNQKTKQQIVEIIKNTEKVSAVFNEIKIAEPIQAKVQSFDTWVTTRAKSMILGTKGLEAINVKVITEDGIVYLMGIVNRQRGRNIAEIVQRIEGVSGVVTAFEYME